MRNGESLIGGRTQQEWFTSCPPLEDAAGLRPTLWLNSGLKPFEEVRQQLECGAEDVDHAADRLERFRPYIQKVFPETGDNGGLIESTLLTARRMQQRLCTQGRLLVKLDSHLPISGSIKARGGIYEILKFAEETAIQNGLLELTDNYEILDSARCRNLFRNYSVSVGSTGNLGLSIGIISARLGFQVSVHMSADAKEWKKEKLRSHGVHVVEYAADYSVAVAEGRKQAQADPHCHFVDDEDSRDLFLGYSVAARRLKKQLEEKGIVVDQDNPLLVYLPCGVGGGPGGVTFGLKLIFGDNVHCFFCEPTHSPAMLVGLATGLHDRVCATEFGIENRTAADGLAVSRPAGLVCRMMKNCLSGVFTVPDEQMFHFLSLFHETEGYRLEPSATVGFSAVTRIRNALPALSLKPGSRSTHLVWATGGSMVPEAEWNHYLASARTR